MTPLKICVVCNFTDTKCGIANFGHQTVTALTRAGHAVTAFDGTYPEVYRRREAGIDPFLPPDIATYDVLHLIWHAITLNHYMGVEWRHLDSHPIRSFWDCGPSDAYCPFDQWFPIKWMLYPRDGYHSMDYPVPDWVHALGDPDPGFVVGASSVRGDGVAELRAVCEAEGWAMNLPTPDRWLSIEDEIRRLARSTVNVCWYNSGATWKDRASAPSMLIASTRPILINHDDLVAHLWDRQDLYHGQIHLTNDARGLGPALREIHHDWRQGLLRRPIDTYRQLMWKTAAARMTQVWQEARG
jgi:hypothetical protein